ncbi:MAG: polyprenyl synthetase family protein, partial [Pseudomonadota bacterium]|nr:polyprenyl synthetase family protein [Pseudomonadota bacterium]
MENSVLSEPVSGQLPAPSLDAMVDLCARAMADVNIVIMEKMGSDVPLIPELAGHLIAAGGKRMRPMLTLLGAMAGSLDPQRAEMPKEALYLAAAVEFIHNATLLHDDVIDESELRRGIKTTNSIWGNQSSILVGDYLLSRCFEMMVED